MGSTTQTKYDFLLALNVGESHEFDNKPTLSEARRKVSPSARTAYYRVSQGVTVLRRHHPDHKFAVTLQDSKGSRISGDLVKVTLLARGDDIIQSELYDQAESRRQRQLDAWKRRKLAEDAPKLPDQLEQAAAVELARRTAGAIRRQQAEVVAAAAPRYDPVKLAQMVAAHVGGATIQKLSSVGWMDEPEPTWTEPTAKYRIKPVLREFYLVVGRNGIPTAVANSVSALPHHDPDCLMHVREILPEDDS